MIRVDVWWWFRKTLSKYMLWILPWVDTPIMSTHYIYFFYGELKKIMLSLFSNTYLIYFTVTCIFRGLGRHCWSSQTYSWGTTLLNWLSQTHRDSIGHLKFVSLLKQVNCYYYAPLTYNTSPYAEVWSLRVAWQIISNSCSFSPETELTALILASKLRFY